MYSNNCYIILTVGEWSIDALNGILSVRKCGDNFGVVDDQLKSSVSADAQLLDASKYTTSGEHLCGQ